MSEPLSAPRIFRYPDIPVGMKQERDYAITPEVREHFLRAFHDHSPLHVDSAYAKACGYPDCVMHGSVLNGFLSHFVGMYFPGRLSLLLAVDLRFAQPSFLGDLIRLEAVVSQKLDARRVIMLDVSFQNVTRNCLAARGRVQVLLREES